MVILFTLIKATNSLIKLLVGNRLGEFIDDAISTNSRGRYLASYDDKEIEEGDYFIYRTN